ncbi:sulfite exporter TauE/SafE family protein [Pontibacterium sp. N1Y112]|uniref:Probable membrane transporter protein n=1 Tax=Pontibacterium sinense TaxID=2781979 RepID=A0A8J7K807_9GAMM|nr:sulfite exporter TauE/SafE family protein [Pontibacterium sinense]MBE9398951.1 sulfite exporter TauE/SafE family protein [Pontibacterium sinense]
MSAALYGLEGEYILFPLISFFAGVISALVGFGGGILMVILLSVFVPIKELIAVIGLVQMGSLLSRMYIYRQHADYAISTKYLVGAIPGTVIAMLLFDQINAATLSMVLGGFLLYSAWKPKGVPVGRSTLSLSFAGSTTAFIAFFVGAPGPAIASILGRFELQKLQFIGSMTVCMLGLNVMKLSAFYSIGFPMERWFMICMLMMLTGILGTVVGSKLMGKVSDDLIYKVVRVAMMFAAIHLFYKSFGLLWP